MRTPLPALSLSLLLALAASPAQAATQYIRLSWDSDPATAAVLGFSPSGTSTNPYALYGTSTDESAWVRANPDAQRTFASSLTSHFLRLKNLSPDTAYYFRVCDDAGCGQRYWFKTAAASAKDQTFVAGGDSRTNTANRQQGNRLVAKVRPEFVLFGGDLTANNTASEMSAWLADWALSFSSDTINGLAYQRVYPIVPTVGNHEDYNQQFVCTVFGVDADGNGQCSNRDTYNAFSLGGGQLRIYTLNTELALSGYEADWAAQNQWLSTDLAGASGVSWRLAQYHKPMFPRTTTKPAIQDSSFTWIQDFYDHKLNLAVESDSHLVKYTYPVQPSGQDYIKATAGTVYLGEGAWGAPRRTADRVSPWIADQDSFDHFNVLQLSGSKLLVRTLRFDGEASTGALSRDERAANPLALPTGMSLWIPANVGEAYSLERDAQGRTTVSAGSGGGTGTITVAASADVTVGSQGRRTDTTSLAADGSDAGEALRGLVYFPLAGKLPAGAVITGAKLRFKVSNYSKGSYGYYAATSAWTETGATWAQAATGALWLQHTPSSKTTYTLSLSASVLSQLQSWAEGTGNFGLVIKDEGTSDGLAITSSETSTAPALVIDYSL
ncbi:MAG: metallophosphoesterase family protein [Gammaproteobacteria bacterium]|nr:metallophosphoesterase family protein [Gammaproteobacteria bacterium]